MAEVATRDIGAFQGVARAELPGLYALARRLCRADAEDLVQDCLLRAYRSFRFRDRHSILTSAEWRWIPSALALDMAIFYDAGKVTSRREDLDLQGLAHDVGVGIRFHGPATTALRVELARGSDGWHVVFATSAPF